MSVAMKIKVAIASDFLSAFSKIPRKQQNKVMDFIDKFRDNPMSSGINYEKINSAKDGNLRSVRIDNTYRAIVLSPETGNVYLLLWVDHHDAAYDWASRRVCNIHPETGSLQVIEVETTTGVVQTKTASSKEKTVGMFAEVRDRQLVSLGIPESLLDLVRSINDEEELDTMANRMPEEAYDALVMLAAGYTIEQVDQELVAAAETIDTGDFSAALEAPDSKRRFYVLDDEMELKAILSAPLEKWRVFLHPSQSKLVNRDWNGPVRVLGGAGTGKTVVALHRAKWLAENRCQDGRKRVLFTTFTRNLAADIRENLRKICGEETFSRIEVTNLDRWVSEYLRKNGYEVEIDFGKRTGPLWEKALTMVPPDLNFELSFYREEWEQVIQPQGITTVTDYFKARRIGRGTKLNRKARKEVWAVFEEYRFLLDENGLREPDDAMRDAFQLLEQKGHELPYCSVVVDEAQDMGHQAFRLIRRITPSGEETQNDIFIVGDGHQRIYRHKVVLGQCGINIRGRSRKLRINYRTTEENRRWAISLLEGVIVDDLDGQFDNQKGYKSLMHGELPSIHHFKTAKEEANHIISLLSECEGNGQDIHSICIVARTNNILEQYKADLAEAGIKTHMIQRNEAEKRSVAGVRLATMHRIKGLEFEMVIIGSVNEGIVPLDLAVSNTDDPVIRKESENRERALLYVAATRAKRKVVVCSYGRSSRFITPSN